MKNFLRLLNYARPFHRFWPGFLVLSVFSVIFGVVNFALLDPLLTMLFETPEKEYVTEQLEQLSQTIKDFTFSVDYFKALFNFALYKMFISGGALKSLLFVCVVFVTSSFFSNASRYISQTILVRMRTHIMKNIRRDLFKKISTMDVEFYHHQQKGDILSRVSNDVTEVQNGIADSFPILFREPLLVIGFLSACFFISAKLTLVTLITIPVSALVIGGIAKKLKAKAAVTQGLLGKIISHFDEAISGIRIIKAFNGEEYVQSKFEKANEEHKKNSRKMYFKHVLSHPLSEFLGITIAAAVLLYGGWLQIHGKLGMSMALFSTYVLMYWRVLEPAKNIANAYASIQRGLVSGERLFKILDAENKIKESDNCTELKEFTNSIEYKNVWFEYNSQTPVLKDISVKISKGEMVALVGPSGAGKSTFADLLPRFYDVTKGAIFIDGVDIRDYSLHSLLSIMGIVTQESILFNDTVYNNITFGLKDVSKERVIEAAKVANALDFIESLPFGFDTNIGDRGENLSGGQRQRIAIARAVLKNPPILILDEATSALDTQSEKLVQDALFKLMKNRTSIVIAHRLSTIKNADKILVLRDGEIVEQGKHTELISKNGVYAKLSELQVMK